MTTETETQPEQVRIGPLMERIIEHMLQKPKEAHYLVGICREIGLYPGTVSPHLRKMEAVGWLTSEWVSPAGARGARKMYRFTPDTAKMLREAIK